MSASLFGTRYDLKLIKLVKSHPMLYDYNNLNYKEFNQREIAWQKISDSMRRPALEFSAIQCQIHFGDFNDEKHKPGLLENLSEYLPSAYASRSAEKKILKLFCKYQGLSHLDAKHLYTKTARDLPTYGVTFFLVKEIQKGKKKMVPRLLGINAKSILRLDENTKEILQVWPLTQVKTYNVGKNDTFTLNFGEYSDKVYSVKTNDALRIRSILEGYIDRIRKTECGPYGAHRDDSCAISMDNVHAGRGNVMTHVINAPSKVVEQSYVGPSQILPFEQGSQASSGTQVMTVQQLIVTSKGSTKQELLSGEVPLRGDMSQNLVKKLNRMNTNAVKIDTLLNEPTEQNLEEVRNIIASMEQDLPIIREGINETAEKQTSEDAKKRTWSEMRELEDLLDLLSRLAKEDNVDKEQVRDQARHIADLTTKMYFSLDPKTKRGSQLLRKSRQSFIADEKMEGTLRRASFIAAAGSAAHATAAAADILTENYNGPALSEKDRVSVETSAVDKLGEMNAAVALFLMSHSDPSSIDYSTAVKSMNTIKEKLPDLANEAKILSHAYGGARGQEILDDVRALCEAARSVCMLTGCEDHDKIQEAASDYTSVSGKLIFTLGNRNARVDVDRTNEIVELSQQVGDAAATLLLSVSELAEGLAAEGGEGGEGGDGGAAELDAQGVRCADAMRDLLTCAQLVAPTIRDAHCQSALTAAVESLATADNRLAVTWKPIVDTPARQNTAKRLAACNGDLEKAMEKLKNAYGGLEDMDIEENGESPEDTQKLRFVIGVKTARDTLMTATDQLNKPLPQKPLTDNEVNKIHDNISQKMAQTNASVATLIQATDAKTLDYDTAEQAIMTISELTPNVVEDARSLISTCNDERGRQAMLNDIRAWCQGIDGVCATSAGDNAQDLQDAAKRFAQASKKLSFVFSPRARKAREQLMVELFNSAHKQAMQMVDDTNKMADAVGGASGVRLRDLSGAVHDSARSLQNTLMMTAPSLEEARCRGLVMERSEALEGAAERLAGEAASLQDDETGCRVLSAQLQAQCAHVAAHAAALRRALAAIKHTLDEPEPAVEKVNETPVQKAQRLKFITSASIAREKAQNIGRILEQPATTVKLNEEETKRLEDKRARELAAVNAAIALLLQAKTDRNNPDYNAAEQAMKTVSELMPGIVNDTKALSGACDDGRARAAMLADMRAWCDAIRAVCASAPQEPLTEFVDSAQKFADTSSKLNFVFNPRRISHKGQQVLSSSLAACDVARRMAADARGAADGLPPLDAARLAVHAQGLTQAAQTLHTTAQLTAPCLEEANSRSALVGASSQVGAEADRLVTHCAEHDAPRCKHLAPILASQKATLDKALNTIKETCESTDQIDDPIKNQQRLKFVTSLTTANKMVDALKGELKKDRTSSFQRSSEEPGVDYIKNKLDCVAKDIYKVNSSVATLLLAKSDAQNPDFAAAEESTATISELVGTIAKEADAINKFCEDKAKRKGILLELREWVDALRGVLARADHGEPKGLNEAAQKLCATTDRMKFVVAGSRIPSKEHEVKHAAAQASTVAERMAEDARLVLASIGGARSQLAAQSDTLVGAASQLRTAAQLTAPSSHEPEYLLPLTNTANNLETKASLLVEDANRSPYHEIKILGVELEADRGRLETALQDLKDICSNKKISMETINIQKSQFANVAGTVGKKIEDVEKILDKPIGGVKLGDKETKEVQEKLSAAMAQVNAALASLINAKSDPQKPNYETAQTSLGLISELIPDIINDTTALSTTCKDAATQEAMLRDIREWCAAIRAVCHSATRHNAKELNDSALKLGDAAQKLRFVISTRKNPIKEQQILQLSSSACDKARQMVAETQRVADVITGSEAELLQTRAAQLSDAAGTMHATAQLTAPTINSERCQAELLQSADRLSSTAATLVKDTARARHPAARQLSEETGRYQAVLEQALRGLRAAVKTVEQPCRPAPPPVPKRSSLNRRRASGAGGAGGATGGGGARVRVVSHSDGRRASQDWLDNMRKDASIDLEASPGALSQKEIAELNKKTEEAQAMKEKFSKTVETADQSVLTAEKEIDKLLSTKLCGSPLDVKQAEAAETRVEHKLALAGTAAATLVGSAHPDVIEHGSAIPAVETLCEMVPDLVKDAALLSNSKDEKSRRRLLDHIKLLCAATRRLMGAAKDKTQKMNEAAVDFGDSSAGLLYLISASADPAQEKGVIGRARAIGDGLSALATSGAELAAAAPECAPRLCRAGRRAAHAASHLVYTAKLVAPLVHQQQCQNALITASHELSSTLKDYSASWKPLSDAKHTTTTAQMTTEAIDLEKLLETFRRDLAAGKLIKRRQVEKIIVDEDSPLRQLASDIMELAQQRAESSNIPDSKKHSFGEYARSLAAAIRQLDVASTRCKQSPNDLSKYQDLENAVQTLQMKLLQSRPALGDKPKSDIVDLNDFIDDITKEAEKFISSTNNIKQGVYKRQLQKTQDICHAMKLAASRLLNPQEGDTNSAEGMLEIDLFAQDCEAQIKDIKSIIDEAGKDTKENLHNLVLPLTESCNFLRFAAKSAVAACQSIALDGALEDLRELQPRLDRILLPSGRDDPKAGAKDVGVTQELQLASARVLGAVRVQARGGTTPSNSPARALAAYVTALRRAADLSDVAQRNQVTAHVSGVAATLRALTAASRACVSLWRRPHCARTTQLTETLIQQLKTMPISDRIGEKPPVEFLNDEDVIKLLMPANVTISVDPKFIEERVRRCAGNLTTLASTLLQSPNVADLLAPSARAVTDVMATDLAAVDAARQLAAATSAAMELAAAARSMHHTDVSQAQRTEQASEDMCWATFSLLRAAEAVSSDPANLRAQAQLRNKAKGLIEAINKLTGAMSRRTLSADCIEMSRALQALAAGAGPGPGAGCAGAVLPAPAPGAPPYERCVQLVSEQRDAIEEKLDNENPMTREEFAQCLKQLTASVSSSTEVAAQGAYLISISEQHRALAKEGLVDVPRLQKLVTAVQDSCYAIMSTDQLELAKEEQSQVRTTVEELQQALKESGGRVRDAGVKRELTECGFRMEQAARALEDAVEDTDASTDKISACTISLADSAASLARVLERPSLTPPVGPVSNETRAMAEHVMKHSSELIRTTRFLLERVTEGEDGCGPADDDNQPMTWTTFNTARKDITDAYEALLTSLQKNGVRGGLVDVAEVEEKPREPVKTFIQIKEEKARTWLQRRPSTSGIVDEGVDAAEILINVADEMSQDLTGQEKDEMRNLITEARSLLTECSKKYDNDNYSGLMELLRDIRRAVEKGTVSRVIEELGADEPLQDLDILLDTEKDESKRKYLLERKIAELLSQLDRVTRVTRCVARAVTPSPELEQCRDQAQLLAPLLVQAAQDRLASPDDKAVVDKYKALLAEYSAAFSRVRELCDSALDPLDFVQAAGETMARLREESGRAEPSRASAAANRITRLAKRVVSVSMSSEIARADPELSAALGEAGGRLARAAAAAATAGARASRLPDWTHSTEEILKTTGEVESALGGENIFKKLPEPDQPIYIAALSLHSAVRGWSARDNEIVAVAKRMAVLMARLSEQMNADRKRELIATSKNIVIESREVAAQAKKLAQECPDVRIRTNLLQVCERIPTISGQLKMLTTVKSSALGLQGGEEDREAMNMLVTNAQNLMSSVQEVVKAAASASVKIASSRGLKWVRKNY